MSVSLKGVVGQLSVVEGVRYPQADNILVVEPESSPTLARGEARLYAVVELSGLVPPPPELRQELLDAVKEEFYQSTGSISAALQQAVRRANDALYEFNLDSERDDRQGGGVTCAALRGTDLYVAQGGPAVTYVCQGGQVTRYPQYSPWLDEEEDGDASPRPLGASRQLQVDLAHVQLRPGDYVILADSLLGQMVSPKLVAAAVALGDVRQAAERLADWMEGEDVSVAVIKAQAEQTASSQELLPAQAELVPDSPPVVRRVKSSRGTKASPQGGKSKASSGPNALQAAWARIEWKRIVQKLENGLEAVWVALLGVLGFTLRNGKILLVRTLPGISESKDEARPQPKPKDEAQPQPKPKDEAQPQPSPKEKPRQPVASEGRKLPVWKYAALGIPLLVLVIAGAIYLERYRTATNTYRQVIQAAQSKQEQALTQMADVQKARSLFSEAVSLLDQAAALSPESAEPARLRKDLLRQLDQINQVKRLYWVPQLAEYNAPGTSLKRIVVDGINVYVLDVGTNRVFKQTLNETGDGFVEATDKAVLLKKGDQEGDVVVSDLLDMTWMPSGSGRQTSNLVIVDKKGALFDYSSTWGIKQRPLAGADKWLYPMAISGFFGNLYVLDPQLNQILKYVSTQDGGYADPPLDYLSDPKQSDLTGAIDMTIDGSIYVLYADGKIAKFRGGTPVSFEITGLDVPLKSPSAIFTSPDQETQFLYVADKGNKRVVQISKEGRFQRQYKAESNAFDDLRSLWVEELEQKMYFLSGNKAYVSNLLAE